MAPNLGQEIQQALADGTELLARVDEVVAAYDDLVHPAPDGADLRVPRLFAACRNLAEFRKREAPRG